MVHENEKPTVITLDPKDAAIIIHKDLSQEMYIPKQGESEGALDNTLMAFYLSVVMNDEDLLLLAKSKADKELEKLSDGEESNSD